MNSQKSDNLTRFSLALFKKNLVELILFYIVISVLIFSVGYLFVNVDHFSRALFFSFLVLTINVLFIVCVGFVLEMKEAVQCNNLKMKLGSIFTPWINLKQYEHMDTSRYWFQVLGYFYLYGLSYFLVLLLSFASGWSLIEINPYLFPIVVVIPNALFQLFFTALPFAAILVPTEKTLYAKLLPLSELVRFSVRILKPYRWHIFLVFVLFPWAGMYLWYLFLDNVFGHLNMLIINIELTLISSFLFLLHFSIISILTNYLLVQTKWERGDAGAI